MNFSKVVVVCPTNTAVKMSLDVAKLCHLSREAGRNIYDDTKDAVEMITSSLGATKTNVMLFNEGGKLVSYKQKLPNKYKISRCIQKVVANLDNMPTA